MFKQSILIALMLTWAGSALSETIMVGSVPIKITSVVSNGSGCAPGTVSVTSTSDNKQIAVLFSKYKAITNSISQVASADCNVAIGLAANRGLSVAIVGIDWRGTAYADMNSYVNFHREFFFSGSTGPSSDTEWSGDAFENFFLEDDPRYVIYSPCDGRPLIARMDTAATVTGPNSLFSLRSADVNARLFLTLKTKPC